MFTKSKRREYVNLQLLIIQMLMSFCCFKNFVEIKIIIESHCIDIYDDCIMFTFYPLLKTLKTIPGKFSFLS